MHAINREKVARLMDALMDYRVTVTMSWQQLSQLVFPGECRVEVRVDVGTLWFDCLYDSREEFSVLPAGADRCLTGEKAVEWAREWIRAHEESSSAWEEERNNLLQRLVEEWGEGTLIEDWV